MVTEEPSAWAERATGGLPWIEDAGRIAPKDARVLSKLFFDQFRVLEEGTREYQYARNTLIEMNQSLVRYAVRRFRSRGNGEMEDLYQVGAIGLIKAIDRFDLSREVEFATFAVPYIAGEIKRYLRDTTWAVHVPRHLQELRVDKPTVAELAEHLGPSDQQVIDGQVAANGYVASSTEAPTDGADAGQAGVNTRSYAETTGAYDPAMERVEDFRTLAPLLEQLGDQDRRIIEMRFGQELTQGQIGVEPGFSQMHISRLLSHVLARLRAGMLTDH
ncbi:sigma-70 family RNA polymerase sigma factor [Streptomyces sp. IB2014 016-6]|uniref:sigma-70 family RNA polymerase sigma factor n=1 Tax=Streptomyces sp. IB2014 016-6 TaxID=2517818 RepID=UPI0011CB9B6C|nr:sigma-70 family RNA polymerase sigma factor [Streptomyces sp. IB2014 016-6]TXL87788.1 sigma-70 family RNA polymerase sigma factor [Streptomyces sp. IB2014 016-6]